jgi:hypothetical protein
MMTVAQTVDHFPMMTMMILVAPQLLTPVRLVRLFDLALGLQMVDVTTIRRQEGSAIVGALNSTVVAVAVAALSGTAVCLQAGMCGLGRMSPMTITAVEGQGKELLHPLSTERDTAV